MTNRGKQLNINIPGWAVVMAALILVVGLGIAHAEAAGQFNIPLSWVLTPDGTSIDADNNNIIDAPRLP